MAHDVHDPAAAYDLAAVADALDAGADFHGRKHLAKGGSVESESV
jgi:hypothetical protein